MYLDSCNNLCIARAIYALERAEIRIEERIEDAELETRYQSDRGGEG